MTDFPKSENILETVRSALASGHFRLSIHAEQRMAERQINLPEVIYVLKHGYRETSKDVFSELWQRWRYAIRGRTMDERDFRVVVSFDHKMWIITIIDKDQ